MNPRSAIRTERGQASVEHVGLIALVALVLVGLAGVGPKSGLGGTLASAISGAFSAGREALAGEQGAERPAESTWAERRDVVEQMLSVGLTEFLAYRSADDHDPRLDYSTDGCSAPLVGSSGASFDFYDACLRHDFGYRNYDRLGIFEQHKAAVDERFLADMRDHCASRPASDHDRCFGWAQIFYEAVRRFGHLSGHGR